MKTDNESSDICRGSALTCENLAHMSPEAVQAQELCEGISDPHEQWLTWTKVTDALRGAAERTP